MNYTIDVIKAYILKRGLIGKNDLGRRGSGITELSRMTGVSAQYLSQGLLGRKKISKRILKKVCEVLNIDYGTLMLLDGAWKGEYDLSKYGLALDQLTERLDSTPPTSVV